MSNYHNMNKDQQLKFMIWLEDNGYLCETYDDYSLEEAYCDMLNDCYEQVNVTGYEYSVSETPQAVDPTVYRCGLSTYVSQEFIELTSGFYMREYRADELVDEYFKETVCETDEE